MRLAFKIDTLRGKDFCRQDLGKILSRLVADTLQRDDGASHGDAVDVEADALFLLTSIMRTLSSPSFATVRSAFSCGLSSTKFGGSVFSLSFALACLTLLNHLSAQLVDIPIMDAIL